MEARLQDGVSDRKNVSADKLVSDLKEIVQRVEQGAVERAKATDKIIRDHPYPSLGVAFGLGILAGFLLWRR